MKRYGEGDVSGRRNDNDIIHASFVSSDRGMGVLVGEQDVNTMMQFCISSKCCAKIVLLCFAIWYSWNR